jgi:hypothetical protein
MPDWRNASHYRFPADFPSYRWVWEFLRRNRDYRKDWEGALARFLADAAEFAEVPDIREFLESGGTLIATGESFSHNPVDPDFYLPVDERERWRLRDGLLNPGTDEPTNLHFNLDFGTVHFMRKGATLQARGPAYPIVEFDLHLPLKPQLEAIVEPMERVRGHLKIKPRRAKHHRKLWPLYLRLLDADLDQRTPKQIADVLAPEPETQAMDEKKVWDQLKAARRMTQPDGYLSIFLSA